MRKILYLTVLTFALVIPATTLISSSPYITLDHGAEY